MAEMLENALVDLRRSPNGDYNAKHVLYVFEERDRDPSAPLFDPHTLRVEDGVVAITTPTRVYCDPIVGYALRLRGKHRTAYFDTERDRDFMYQNSPMHVVITASALSAYANTDDNGKWYVVFFVLDDDAFDHCSAEDRAVLEDFFGVARYERAGGIPSKRQVAK